MSEKKPQPSSPALPFCTSEWVGGLDGYVRLLDQTLLPEREEYRECRTLDEMWEAIRVLRVRGAPAIGVAAAMGVVLGTRESQAATHAAFLRDLEETTERLATARPTAVNLFWALRRMEQVARSAPEEPVEMVKERLLKEARRIRDEDRETCRRIGRNGAALVRDGDTWLTHCNAGALATAGSGTALSVFYAAHEQGKRFRVFADETRPLLQGARLTAWELQKAGIEVTVLCDAAAAYVLRTRRLRGVIVGADRIAANGDVANKIGTYGLAIAAKAHGVPFYVAAPLSTFDRDLADGEAIPIEERGRDEVAAPFGHPTTPATADVLNLAFDVTPHEYVTAIITERGLIERPDAQSVAAHMEHARRS